MMSFFGQSPLSNPEINRDDDDQTIVFAENTNSPDDQTLSSAVFTIVFNVIRNFYPRTASLRTRVFMDHNTKHKFECPIHRLWMPLELESVIFNMLSSIEIPFDWERNLFWKDHRSQSSVPTPLSSVRNMVARVSDFAIAMNRSAVQQGLKKIGMLVTMEKRIVIGDRNFARICSIRRLEDDLGSCRLMMSRVREHERRLETSTWLRPSRTLEDFRNVLTRRIVDLNLRRLEVAVAAEEGNQAEFQLKPVAGLALEALEKLRYDGKSDDDDQSTLTCSVCVEDVEIGSHITRLPCSHMFHWNCILKWLKERQTCPLCRLNLLIDF